MVRLRRAMCAPLALALALATSSFAQAEEAPAPAPAPADAGREVRSLTVESGRQSIRIPRVSRPPEIDDFVNGRPREAEARVTDFRQFAPGDGDPISQPTEAYLSYDGGHLYVVFVCQDDPKKVRAHLTQREGFWDESGESAFGDDFVSVNLDTFLDRRRAYVFTANPLGIQRDALYTVGRGSDLGFDALWKCDGRLTPTGFVVRFAIPFKSVRFPDSPQQTWGIALGRIITRRNEICFWPYITRRIEGLVQQCATLEGIEHVSTSRNLQVIAHGAYTYERLRPFRPQGSSSGEGRAGLDGKWVFKDSITLDATVNPDFSQVESDEPRAMANERFEVFFPEKRPFFLENAGFFQGEDTWGGLHVVDPLKPNLFFSRRVVDPQFGARLTGKPGRWALGGLFIDDRAPGRLSAETEPLHDQRAGIGVVRIQRELPGQSNVGFLATSRNFGGGWNRVLSLDTRVKLSPKLVFNGQMMRSYTRRLDGTQASGPAYQAELLYAGRRFGSTARYVDRSPDFEAQLSNFNRVDIRQVELYPYFSLPGKRGPILDTWLVGRSVVNWDRRNDVQDWYVEGEAGFAMSHETRFRVTHAEAFERYLGIDFRRHGTLLGVGTQPARATTFSGRFGWGTCINYNPPVETAPFLSTYRDGYVAVIVHPVSRLRLEQSYIYSRLRARQGGGIVFTNHIARTRVGYQFTRALSVRGILDYNALTPAQERSALIRNRRLSGDFLLTYLFNPWTAFYLGYSDIDESATRDVAKSGGAVDAVGTGRAAGRQVFAKLSYLFHF